MKFKFQNIYEMKNNPFICIPTPFFISLQALITMLLHVQWNRNSFWPGIDIIALLDNGHNTLNPTDLYVGSSFDVSGRSPYILFMSILNNLLPGSAYNTVAIVSAFTVCLASPLLFLALYSCSYMKKHSRKFKISTQVLICWLFPVLTYPIWSKIPVTLAGYGPFIFEWVTPEYLGILLASGAFFALNTSSKTDVKLFKILLVLIITLSILIHPTSVIILLIIVVTFKIVFKTLRVNEFQIVVTALILSVSVLMILYIPQSTSLTSMEFVEIYAEARHPHHYIVSQYLNIYSLILYLSIFLFLFIACKKSSRYMILTGILLLYFTVFNFCQFIFTELIPNKLIASFGPSRINTYILMSTYIVFVLYLNRNIPNNETKYSNKLQPKHQLKKFKLLTIFFLTSSLVVPINNINSDYHNLSIDVKRKLQKLNLSEGELVLINPASVDTIGWREFGKTSIWFDIYFSFNLEGIREYRKRWLEICPGEVVFECDLNYLIQDHSKFVTFMQVNKISKLVVSNQLTEYQMGSEFSLAGRDGNLISYNFLPRLVKHK